MTNTKKFATSKLYLKELKTIPTKQKILKAETHYQTQIKQIVDTILTQKEVHFILLAGPSSSGKTTSSHIMQQLFEQHKKHAKVISLDDFFLERDQTPDLPNGDKDYDSVNSIDWKLFDKCMSELLEKKVSQLPTYNFLTGTKEFNNPPTTLKEDEVLIIEGLHALNPIINNFIPHQFSRKVFVCPKTEFVQNDQIILDIFNLRLMRRLIRDVRTRGIEPSETLYFWKNVREAENLYVLPFEKEADFLVDTTHSYEPGVYKSILSVLLKDHGEVLQQLLTLLEGFEPIAPNQVPDTSVLKEFVG
jgi:uridine kinase